MVQKLNGIGPEKATQSGWSRLAILEGYPIEHFQPSNYNLNIESTSDNSLKTIKEEFIQRLIYNLTIVSEKTTHFKAFLFSM